MIESSKRRRIAYYCMNDPLDKRSWSGTTYYLGQSLQKYSGDVDFLGPVKIPFLLDKTLRVIQKLFRLLFKTEYIPKYGFIKNRYASVVLKKRMKGKQYNLLFAPAATSELASLTTKLPVVYFNDATFKLYSETYSKEFKNVSIYSKWTGNLLEKKAIKKSSLMIYTSHWAARSAINDYGAEANKVEVLLLGANIDKIPEQEIIFLKEKNSVLTLIFLAVDWERKGGAIAFDTLLQLHASGIHARLIVCGVTPPPQFAHPQMEVISFLNKNNPEDYKHFIEILSNAHFLILPTRADCSLLVNAEANAFGVPTITTNVGGVSDVVTDDVNGYCLPLYANGAEYALLIKKIFLDKEKYHDLIISSRKKFDEVLNWKEFALHFNDVLKNHNL